MHWHSRESKAPALRGKVLRRLEWIRLRNESENYNLIKCNTKNRVRRSCIVNASYKMWWIVGALLLILNSHEITASFVLIRSMIVWRCIAYSCFRFFHSALYVHNSMLISLFSQQHPECLHILMASIVFFRHSHTYPCIDLIAEEFFF